MATTPTAAMMPFPLEQALGWVHQRLLRDPNHPWGSWLFHTRERGARDRLLARTQSALATPSGYRLSPVSLRHIRGSQRPVECWDAVDAWALKALALLLTPLLSARLSRRCFHLPGRGRCQGRCQGAARGHPHRQIPLRCPL